MFETSKIELSKSALKQNLKFIQSKLDDKTRFCSVVKGNAYGHGLGHFIQMSMELGVSYFAVHSADEAYRLVQSCSERIPDLFIMGSIPKDAIEWSIMNHIEMAVFNEYRLLEIIESAQRLNKKAKIHIELETGMWRTSFSLNALKNITKKLTENKNVVDVIGVFTHLAGAESRANQFRIHHQLKLFNLGLKELKESGIEPKYVHTACSAAIMNYPEAPGNMVRIGILQYGFWPNRETFVRFIQNQEKQKDVLKRVIRWSSAVMDVFEVDQGEFIGYGTSFLTSAKMKLAVVPVGYSHGYNRNLSNIGHVLIRGKEAPVVGVVNMNSISVNVTTIKNVEIGDEVVLIGYQNSKSITVNSFSEQAQQLNYELLTRLPFKIPRVITR